ncbi:MAG TPA: DUF2232 domain-containing protein [Pseudolabrys sp.]|nr:DUF2232 domain-containing protein [Pseudolabrys sp.]
MTKTQIALVGIGAGAAAALMFASVASGSLLSIFLFYVAPLPIMIAALGWSHWAAMIAALGAATTLASVFGGMFFLAFMIGTGIPAWWLGYLAMLARPGANEGSLEWYPPGRLVLWCAVLATIVISIGVLTFGTDLDTFRTEMRRGLERMIYSPPGMSGDANRAQLFDFLVTVLPAAAAVVATTTNAINLWLAARIVKFSGRLQRPWPHLPAMTFPGKAAAVLAVAVGLTFIGGIGGLLAMVASAALVIAYGILGFAVLHAVTRHGRGRGLVLGIAYASVIVFFWPIFALCLLGLADTAIDLRGRAARRGGPPAVT